MGGDHLFRSGIVPKYTCSRGIYIYVSSDIQAGYTNSHRMGKEVLFLTSPWIIS